MHVLWKNQRNILIVLAMFVALVYVVLLWPWNGRFYWLYVDANYFYFADALVDFTPPIGLIILVAWAILQLQNAQCRKTIFILVFVTCACILSFFSLGAFFGQSSKHLDEVHVRFSTYRLAYWDTGGSAGTSYILFQCDFLGIKCIEVYDVSTVELIAESPPKLIVDSEQKTIVLKQDEQVLFTRRVG